MSSDFSSSCNHLFFQKTLSSDVLSTQINATRRSTNTVIKIGAAILIQRWYRRARARLEMRRRTTWMIYQSLEYAGEQNCLKLYDLFSELLSQGELDGRDTQDSSAISNVGDALASDQKQSDKIWNIEKFAPPTQRYDGPSIQLPIDIHQVMRLIDFFSKNNRLPSQYVYTILDQSRQLLFSRPNIQLASTSISKHITVVGDLHGQFTDLQTILHKNGLPDVTNPYIFNGDFVDRGKQSIETLLIILALMLSRPSAVYLNRGNHEDHFINEHYGFVREIQKKYKSNAGALIKCLADFYRYLPLATLIDDSILVLHGGVSGSTDLDLLESCDRMQYVSLRNIVVTDENSSAELKLLRDLLWSDPTQTDGEHRNERRGMGCLFGGDITRALLEQRGYSLLIRSHECKPDGFEWGHDGKLLTVFSASNYYSEGSNLGAFARVGCDGGVQLIRYLTKSTKKAKTNVQKIHIAEDSAVAELKQQIMAKRNELLQHFTQADSDRTGSIPLSTWCSIMELVLDLKLPWHTLQPNIAIATNDKMVQYASTFESINVRNDLTKTTPMVAEELYTQRYMLERIFRNIDKDDSGHITLDEFRAACNHLPSRASLDEETLADITRSIDINKDGLIDFNEFLEAFRLVNRDMKMHIDQSIETN